jgi:hypothetical protein
LVNFLPSILLCLITVVVDRILMSGKVMISIWILHNHTSGWWERFFFFVISEFIDKKANTNLCSGS